MNLDLRAIGPPDKGLFLFGKRVEPKSEARDRSDADKKGISPRTPEVGKVSLNPYVEALETMEKLEKARKVLAPFLPAPARKGVGSHIDLRA